ncbi:1-acyl-sn-glycerol-3-phosphate acyltransferase [Vitiosangium sp. GDMCC 1.1324]|uniref:lysophospholipid acyltransferase family protein n=1 Tax=Vitiosangium sp. (strain GDMCC 1.1324) TaxID=2138576 RepID=UPI00130EDE27|nr:lysophospholipid acyltransferase family protein [Vitiosangium sp. GDMCC 1.1324]
MRLLLSVLVWTWIALWATVLVLLSVVLFIPFNPWTDPRRRVMDFMNRLWARGSFWAMPGIVIEVVGEERLREHPGPFVICSNHQSVADIPLMLAVLPPFKFIAKPPLFWVPILGLQLRLTGHIEAGRGEEGAAQRVLSRSMVWLQRGANILAFPEGTRSRDDRVLRFGQGPFALAQRAGVPVLPVSVSGTGEVIAKGRFLYRFVGRFRVEILEPVRVEGDPKAVASRVRSLIQEAVERGVTRPRVQGAESSQSGASRP